MTTNDPLVCPITLQLFQDPVVAEDGHTYERKAICEWIKEHATSPITHQTLTVQALRPNHTVKKLIEGFEINSRQKHYQFKLGEDVKKARRPLYQAFGKAIYEAEWIRQTNGPKFILLQIDGARARKEAAFYVELSRHPYIVRTYGLVQQQQNNLTEDDSVMLLQEYATEGSLYNFLREQSSVLEELTLSEIFLQIADAMAFLAHNNVVHGDLACRNVLVFRYDEHEPKHNLVKLTDFGLSRYSTIYQPIQGVRPAATTMNIIPVRYAAPEILSMNNESKEVYSEKSDTSPSTKDIYLK
ncbi:unnamed protein product [Didymodactylos carnosus]|uniref:Uncharacterized protein n=1 Tax=Didymodactylos carnosus TaxID=1234261 RepID=A0A8S2HMR0_9BILA|nr:unnamed protein product [Didymodactylos carnosus]CAF3661779.1 unnamed protein product [Didymodactylos carnosus]